MMSSWKSMPRKNQNITLALVVLMMFFAYWMESVRMNKKTREVANQIAIREKRAKLTLAAPSSSTVKVESSEKLKKQKEMLESQLSILMEQAAQQEQRLAPLDDPAIQQRQQLALAKLAQNSDVEMQGFKLIEKNPTQGDAALAPTVDGLRQAFNNEFKRPLYVFTAKASYNGLMQVLEGLTLMEYAIAPVDFSVKVEVELAPETKAGAERKVLRQWLNLRMILAF